MIVKLIEQSVIKIVVMIIVLALLYLLANFIVSLRTWHYDEPLYNLLLTIRYFLPYFLVLVILIGIIIILIHSWLKVLGYLEVVIDGTQKVYRDKTQLIEMPIELKDVERQMNQIRLNILENQSAIKEVESRKNDLVMYLAHDLKTPLTSIIGYLTLLKDEKDITENLRDNYLSITVNKAEQLEHLINEFFEITRFNYSNITLEMSKVNLYRMFEQIIDEFKPMFLDKELTCQLQAPQDLIIRCDVEKMQRVFDNLLRNAVNYSFEQTTIEINITMVDKGLKINFINHGDTISPEKLNRIFEQFYRLDQSRSSKNGGAGLGLAISKEIVNIHGGQLTASSMDDRIDFQLILPIK